MFFTSSDLLLLRPPDVGEFLFHYVQRVLLVECSKFDEICREDSLRKSTFNTSIGVSSKTGRLTL